MHTDSNRTPSLLVVADAVADGLRTRTFRLPVDGEDVPGVLWTPADASDGRPKVLLGHGGTQHKLAPNIAALVSSLVRGLGIACVSIDAPGHGDRVSAEQREAFRRAVRKVDPTKPRDRGKTTDPYSPMFLRGVRDWHAVLDAVESEPDVGAGPTGWWGVSMGTSIGLPFVATEPRVTCAVLGLASTVERPGHAEYLGWAASVSAPLLFLCQRDDGGHPIADALDLFDRFGSTEKTMHLNPGGHVEIPAFERHAAVRFFARHLLEEHDG